MRGLAGYLLIYCYSKDYSIPGWNNEISNPIIIRGYLFHEMVCLLQTSYATKGEREIYL